MKLSAPKNSAPSRYRPQRSLLLAPLIGCAAFMGCSRTYPDFKSTLIIGIESEIKNLDLRRSTDANSWHISRMLSQSLVTLDSQLLPVPDLAESFEIIGDKVFRFTLPKKAHFHDGTPIDSEAVKANFVQAATSSPIASNFSDVLSFETPTPQSFVITLNKANPAFLLNAVERILILAPHIKDEQFRRHPVASGPFRFVKRHNRDLVFKRFEKYLSHTPEFLNRDISYDKLIVRMIQDQSTRYLSLLAGDVDIVINALPGRRVMEARESERLDVHTAAGSSYTYIGINLNLEKFKDIRVRKALALAINRDEIIKHKLYGLATKANSVIPPSNPFHNADIENLPFNPDKARALLKEAGAESLPIELKISSDREVNSIALVFKKQWEDVGFQVHIRPFDFGTFFADIRQGNAELYVLRWTSLVEPDLLYSIFHSSELPPGRNRIGYSNQKVDELLEMARIEGSVENRKKLYSKAQKLISEDIPYISLWHPDNTVVAGRQVSNMEIHSTGAWRAIFYSKKNRIKP